MDRSQLDILFPMLYSLAIVVCAVTDSGILSAVAIIGAVVLGIYYAVLRRSLPEPSDKREPRS